MTILVCEPSDCERLIAQRQALGHDRYDEVWDGVYVMAPLANNEHQLLALDIAHILKLAVGTEQGLVFAGVNVSDRTDDWKQNYRCPDVAVYLADNPAQDCDSHWLGGPDRAEEIVSPGDRSRAKLDFYAKVGTRELLIVDRDPWSLELYVLKRKKLKLVGRSSLEEPRSLESTVLPLSFQLTAGKTRPLVKVSRTRSEAV
jgi:Uma2 family endonuclease